MWRWCRIFLVVLTASTSSACCWFLWALWRATELRPTAGGKPVALDSISLQIDILSLTLAAVGIALAAIGLFGYQSLKEVAEARAERAAIEIATRRADEIATAAVSKHIENLGRAGSLERHNQAATIEPSSVTEVGKTEDENGRNP